MRFVAVLQALLLILVLHAANQTTGGNIDISDVADASVFNDSRYEDMRVVDSRPVEEGNITPMDLDGNTSTEKWAGFYGNVTGNLVLGLGESRLMYNWTWSPASAGAVCVSTNATLATRPFVYAAPATDVDTAWGFDPADSDSGVNTFNESGCNMTIGSSFVEDADYSWTGSTKTFATCAMRLTTSVASKGQMLFCSNITQGGTLFNGQTGDFEILAPTSQDPATYETYYFYIHLT